MLRASSERLAGPHVAYECKGSFDCVSVHFVNGNFAQDDKSEMNA